jgi:hypothetical protein
MLWKHIFASPTGVSGAEQDDISCVKYLDSGRLVSPTNQSRTKQHIDVGSASNPICNMTVDAMRPAFNFEPKYRVTMSTREDWIKGTGTPVVKGLVWFTEGSKMREGTRVGVYGQSVGRRLSFSLGRYATVFQANIYAILACVHENQFQGKPEKHVRICSDSQADVKALMAVRMSPLVQ